MKQINKLLVLFFLIVITLTPVLAFQTSLVYYNNSLVKQIFYDRIGTQANNSNYNSSYGSDSYMDHSWETPNIYLKICGDNLSIGDKIDLVYTSKNKSIIQSALLYDPQITSIFNENTSNGTIECSKVDVFLAASKTLFPGYLTPILIPKNSSYNPENYNASKVEMLDELPVFLNGSFDVGIEVVGPPKKYQITVVNAYDENKQEITRNDKQLIVSVLSQNGTVDNEDKLALGESLIHTQEIKGGETVYVNDLKSLEILTYDPCTPINGSGYYLMNDSVYNRNKTCINISNSSQLVINFGDEIIVGDGEKNGSKTNDTCAVMIKNSQDITLENLKTSNYYYGLCIKNSSVTVYGTGTTQNFRGARVDDNSNVTFVKVKFSNEDSEIVAENDSNVTFYSVNLTSASLKSTFRNVKVKSVSKLPEPLNIPGLKDIGQYVEYINLTPNNSRAQISFKYTQPLPNNVVTDNITIYEYERGKNITTTVLKNRTVYNATTNTSTIQYYNETIINETPGNWSPVYTLVSPSEQLIISPVLNHFSIFAPYGFEAPPNPKPTPTPQPNPVTGTSTGNGGTPQSPAFETATPAVKSPVFVNLSVSNNISLMQGEAGQINYSIKNIGDADVEDILLKPEIRRGWDYSNKSVRRLKIGESQQGKLLIAPYEKELPGRYPIPITLYLRDSDGKLKPLRREIVMVNVLPRQSLRRLKILEYPPEILYTPYSEIKVAFLAKNIGDYDLNNITVVAENNSCLRDLSGKPEDVKKGDTSKLIYTLKFRKEGNCQTNLKFYSGDNLVGFLPLTFKEEQKGIFSLPKTTDGKKIFWLVIITIWTLLTAFVFERRRKRL